MKKLVKSILTFLLVVILYSSVIVNTYAAEISDPINDSCKPTPYTITVQYK